jgi:hypothetical protein
MKRLAISFVWVSLAFAQQPIEQVASVPVSATLQNAATANGNGATLTVTGMSAAMLTVNCASCSGGTTVNFEATQDSSNFVSVNAIQQGSTTIASSTTAAGITVWEIPVAGFVALRARISAYSAGTITVTGNTVPVPFDPKVIISTTIAALTSATQSTASTNATSVKGSPGTIFNISAFNTTTTIYYLRMYNTSSAPTCSSATGFVETLPVPPAAASGGSGGFIRPIEQGQQYTTGIGFCITGGPTSTDNTNAAVGVFVSVLYD